jgi:hypothetical protein
MLSVYWPTLNSSRHAGLPDRRSWTTDATTCATSAGHEAAGEQEGVGEGRGDRHLLVVAAARDLQRQQLAEEHAEGEQPEQERRASRAWRVVLEHHDEEREAEDRHHAAEAAGRRGEQVRHVLRGDGRRRPAPAACAAGAARDR